MKVTTLELQNIRGFIDTGVIGFSSTINIITGKNNSGKSTLLRSLYVFQDKNSIRLKDLRSGAKQGKIFLHLNDYSVDIANNSKAEQMRSIEAMRCDLSKNQLDTYALTPIQTPTQIETLAWQHSFFTTEPDNVYYPFFSKRKINGFSSAVENNVADSVSSDFKNLTAKIARLAPPQHAKHTEYSEACQKILNIGIYTVSTVSGLEIGISIGDRDSITIDAMGDGVPNILGLITNLCMAKNQVFLIEELENDLHPEALKELLNLIVKKSAYNQFFISTHSNIVIKHLGALADSKLFNVSMDIVDGIPTSTITTSETHQQRRTILEELGYDLFDFDLAQGWLILEESSAERIIREYFIPWFTPKLSGKLKTVAAQGIANVIPRVQAFKDLFTFLHLEPIYKNKAWVAVDGDAIGKTKIEKLKATFCINDNPEKCWPEDHFQNFSKENFELYYPAKFQPRAKKILKMKGGEEKQGEKKKLLDDVIAYIEKDQNKAKSEFEKRSLDIITLLQTIRNQLS